MDSIDDIFTPHQKENPPYIDITLYKEVNRVDLKNLPEGTRVLFSGLHPASNYLVEVLGTPELGLKRDVKLWYLGSGSFNSFGAVCLIGPQSGCLKTKAKNLYSFTINNRIQRKPDDEGILELGKQYMLPTFGWDYKKELYADTNNIRLEAYTKIKVPTELKE
ncbi:hypothetical protein A2642_01895 [Candidatus Nomurabacteria bacterium RIFCSPHIGHO2_01_FULL_39_10]|uniref:Uncharacterized protein n=1 Tax=Candidatus Nomurabacteria bacterium RIFCSPHIGHO2_01_FULL_39_10 TaxID=1801733 RepID=A0A1F6V507_9BACT|nr:MAG: hypothetical protein A2642_01895 [Candidatus Nomurabacteria bacterium RIFCSPHIGHO2_01_FULL_39_10]